MSLPRSAYLHVPFCRHRCGYCNFSVIADRDELMTRFLSAIDRELADVTGPLGVAPTLDTLFVGGGTPTHLPVELLDRFLRGVRERFELAEGYEWTVEANPEDISADKIAVLVEHGVNRVSLGVQSFAERKLEILERSHSGRFARQAIRTVAESIPNVSIDLIFGAPGESLADWETDLIVATSLPVRHVSTYALTFEKGTSFWSRRKRGGLTGVDESVEIEMYDLARTILPQAGARHYEISNFAEPPNRCRHNLAYWQGEDWFAAGPGAAAFVGGRRTVNHRSTTTYLKRIEAGESPIGESESVTPVQAARECAAFGVRMIDGIDLDDIRTRFGVDIGALCRTEVDALVDQGLLSRDGTHVRLTERGIHFADTVAGEFLGFAE